MTDDSEHMAATISIPVEEGEDPVDVALRVEALLEGRDAEPFDRAHVHQSRFVDADTD